MPLIFRLYGGLLWLTPVRSGGASSGTKSDNVLLQAPPPLWDVRDGVGGSHCSEATMASMLLSWSRLFHATQSLLPKGRVGGWLPGLL